MHKFLFILFVAVGSAFALEEAPLYLFFPGTLSDWCISYGKCGPDAVDADCFSVVAPSGDAEVSLLSDAQKEHLDMPGEQRLAKFAEPETRQKLTTAGYHPQKVTLKWKCQAAGATSLKLAVSENPDMVPSVVLSLPPETTHVELNNLKIARTYYWRLMAEVAGTCHASHVFSFATEAHAPRFVKIPGIINVRDLGGWIGMDGRRVKQGLIYRSGALNAPAVEATSSALIVYARKDLENPQSDHPELNVKLESDTEELLTPMTREYVADFLGIRTDLDLRGNRECSAMTGSPAGPDVLWLHYSSSVYEGMVASYGRDGFKKTFRVFLNPNNYPIDIHCTFGQGRTGSIAFILNALLGVPEQDLCLDWEISAFWNGDLRFKHETGYDKLFHAFDAFPGETIQQRMEAYILSLGFTREDIDFLRNFLLE